MKKNIFLLIIFCLFTACETDNRGLEYPPGGSNNNNDDSWVYKTLLDKYPATRIKEVIAMPMLREFSLPLNHYILRLEDGNAICCLFLSYNFQLKKGDKISKYYTYKVSPNEAYEIHTPYGIISYEKELENVGKKTTIGTKGLILSDRKNGEIVDIFYMKIRQTLILFPGASFIPVNTMFIKLSDGTWLYVQDIFSGKNFSIGDKISYKVLNLCPSKIMSITKIKP